ncbi:Uncharacterised protein [Vibrio cholerae]|nr:Uncharacterised protein [Vibrio cholerae]CSI50820.1 Uncharacterised protein [Vibrio cholerae]
MARIGVIKVTKISANTVGERLLENAQQWDQQQYGHQ